MPLRLKQLIHALFIAHNFIADERQDRLIKALTGRQGQPINQSFRLSRKEWDTYKYLDRLE